MKKFLTLLFLFCSVFAFGQSYPERPNPPRLVNDLTGTLSAGEVAQLEQRLVAFDNQTTNQVTIVIIPTTGGTDPAEYATELGRKWGVGNKVNNGVILLIAKNDRKLSIVPGYGLEQKLTDATTQSIIDNQIVPQFKGNNYYQGISNGVESIIQATQGEYKADSRYANRGRSSGGGSWLPFLIIIIVIIFLISRRGGGRGGGMMSRRGYGGFSSPIWWLPMGGGGSSSGGGGFGSGGGGGGFGGFGGGSFGGGGSSGSW